MLLCLQVRHHNVVNFGSQKHDNGVLQALVPGISLYQDILPAGTRSLSFPQKKMAVPGL